MKNILKIVTPIAIAVGAMVNHPAIANSQPTDNSLRNPKSKTYVLVGVDSNSNPYVGGTATSEAHTLLCIKPSNLPKPAGLPPAVTTPGGALRDSWSSAYLFPVPNIKGSRLTSKAVADGICSNYVKSKYGVSDARMAEFHDGDKQAGWAGWSYWGDASYLDAATLNCLTDRLWVSINDQSSNPWGQYQSSNGKSPKALTFTKTNQIQLR